MEWLRGTVTHTGTNDQKQSQTWPLSVCSHVLRWSDSSLVTVVWRGKLHVCFSNLGRENEPIIYGLGTHWLSSTMSQRWAKYCGARRGNSQSSRHSSPSTKNPLVIVLLWEVDTGTQERKRGSYVSWGWLQEEPSALLLSSSLLPILLCLLGTGEISPGISAPSCLPSDCSGPTGLPP
jgi:hypothetical protein